MRNGRLVNVSSSWSAWLLVSSLFAIGLLAGDLAAVRKEPNLERRAELALTNADAAVTAARTAYEAGKADEFAASLTEVRDSVDLCLDSLEATGKHPRRNPKYFKRSELKLRTLSRRMATLAAEVGFDDRPKVEELQKFVDDAQEQLITGIMSRRKKS